MPVRNSFCFVFLAASGFLAAPLAHAQTVTIEGAPADSGFNVGSEAVVRVTVNGVGEDPSRFSAFVDIQYVGTSATTSVQMDGQAGSRPGERRFEARWPIPADAPTGLYSAIVRVEDRRTHQFVATKPLRSFAAYKKIVRIARVSLDKTFYSLGDPIQCEVVIENLSERELKGLRVEFSNANYPWISLFGRSNPTGKYTENPELALRVLRDHINLAALGRLDIPMMPAGTAAFLQGQQVAVLGAGGPARHEKTPPPEVDQYTVAVWNAERTVLYDMQFSPEAIVRPVDHDLPKPYYSHNFTHPYNSDIDFEKYRRFYAPAEDSPAFVLDHTRSSFRPGDLLAVNGKLRNPDAEAWRGVEVRAALADSFGKELHTSTLLSGIDLAPGETHDFEANVATVPAGAQPGVYAVRLAAVDIRGQVRAAARLEVGVSALPASILVLCPHEDDEHAYAGLIRAAVEAGVPVRVVIFTGGDVGACERYYSKPCGPNEAREFGMVRMEESAEALEHIGLTRDKQTFLGLPDGGSGAIWSENIRSSNPFLSIYLATDHAPYENIFKPNLPYARDAVIEAVKQIISDFHPALIATPHPDERHVDHRTVNWFAVKACQELLREGRLDSQTIVLADQSYGSGGFKAAPYRYEKWSVYLGGDAAARKQEMGWIYQSQDGNLEEGMRKTFGELSREELHYRIVDWQEHTGWNE